MKVKDFISAFYKAGDNLINNDGTEQAGYITFLIIISIFPFILFLITIMGFIGESAAGQLFIQKLMVSLPKEFLPAIIPRIQEIVSGPPQSFVAVAFLSLLWTASSFIQAIRNVLNRVYKVESPPSYFLRRLGTMVYFLILIVILAFVIFILFFGHNIYQNVISILQKEVLGFNVFYLELYSRLLGPVVILSVVYLSYYTLPDLKKKKLASFFPGTILVIVCWFLITKAFSFYLETFDNVYVIYGSLAGFVVSMFYLYALVLIYIFGAEFNYSYNKIKGKKTRYL